MSEIVIYTTEDGLNRIELRVAQGTVWLTQMEIADLFATTKQNVSLHISNILEDGELNQTASVKESLTVQTEGARQVERTLLVYNLDMILAVGYRVRSPRGVQFRRWASTVLSEYLIKGFVMDDVRLKQPDFDYFDELLERIRDIRASEARFYKKVRDILALSEDYNSEAKSVAVFYATIQNKMLYAVTGFTAAELIVERADPTAPNMGLTSWKGTRVRKGDVKTAKNYLADAEISELNLIVTMFLDTADLRARRRQSMRLADWDAVLDNFLQSNELPRLANAGSVSHERAVGVAEGHYDSFDTSRKLAEQKSDLDISELEELEKIAKSSKKEDKA
jgi:hypothetical protein